MSLLTHYEAVQTAKKILSSSSPSVTESVLWYLKLQGSAEMLHVGLYVSNSSWTACLTYIVSHLILYMLATEGTAKSPQTPWLTHQLGLGRVFAIGTHIHRMLVTVSCYKDIANPMFSHPLNTPEWLMKATLYHVPPKKTQTKPIAESKRKEGYCAHSGTINRRKTLWRIVVEYIWITNTFEEIPVCLGTEKRKINSSHYSLEIICSALLLNVSAKDDF